MNEKKRNTRATRLLMLVTLVLSLVAAACASDDDVDDALDAGQSTVESVADEVEDETDDVDEDDVEDAQSSLSTALSALGLTSLSSAVSGVEISDLTDADEFTFFAPNDEAFTSMTADELADLLSDPERLRDVLRNHLIEERIDSTDLAERTSVTSSLGQELDVTATDGTVTVGGATVVQADEDAGDGVIHVVDGLILPS